MKKIFLLLLFVLALNIDAQNEIDNTFSISAREIEAHKKMVALKLFSLSDASMHIGDIDSAINFLKKAIEYDSSIYLKEKLLRILFTNSIYDDNIRLLNEIVDIGESYYEKNSFSGKILFLIALASEQLEDFEKADKFYRLTLQTEKTMPHFIQFYRFKKQQGIQDSTLLSKALSLPWEEEKILIDIAELYGEFNPSKKLDILEKTYQKWNSEEVLTALLRIYDQQNDNQTALALLRKRLASISKISESLKSHFISLLFKESAFAEIVENQEICFASQIRDDLIYLMIAAWELEDFRLALKAVEQTLHSFELPNDVILELELNIIFFNIVLDKFEQAVEKIQDYNPKSDLVRLISKYSLKNITVYQEKLLATFSQLSLENNELANFLLLLFHWKFGEKETANSFFSKIKPAFIQEHKLNTLIASAHLDINDDIVAAEKILQNDPEIKENSEILIAQLLYELHKDSLAIHYLQNIFQTQKQPAPVLFILFSRYQDQINQTEYLQIMQKGVDLFPDNADILNSLGYFIADENLQDKFPLAEEMLSKATKLEPESIMIWDSYAWLQFRKGNYEQALAAMQIPLQYKIEHAEIAFHLAEIYWKLDVKEKALNFYQLVLQFADDEMMKELAQKKLDKFNK